MRGIKHALSGAVYELTEDGTITVEKDGKTGTFRSDGYYLEGDIKWADPHLCQWIAGPATFSHRYGSITAKQDQHPFAGAGEK
jgi:hypothetical protein